MQLYIYTHTCIKKSMAAVLLYQHQVEPAVGAALLAWNSFMNERWPLLTQKSSTVQSQTDRHKLEGWKQISVKRKIKKWLKHIFFTIVLGIYIKISVGRLIISELSFVDFKILCKSIFHMNKSDKNYDESVALCLCCCVGWGNLMSLVYFLVVSGSLSNNNQESIELPQGLQWLGLPSMLIWCSALSSFKHLKFKDLILYFYLTTDSQTCFC